MSIIELIERIRREPPYADPEPIFPEQRYRCHVVDPIPWDRAIIERELDVVIPDDLAMLWDSCGGLRLYEDDLHRQWGLVVYSPQEVLEQNFAFRVSYRAEDAIRGDLIFARFWGDLDLGLMRCDKSASDYGSVLIVADMGGRPEWHRAAQSVEEFLGSFMDAHGRKYWSYHYQKELAERAAQEILRARQAN